MFTHMAEIRNDFAGLGKLLKGAKCLKGAIPSGLKAQLPSLFGIFENYPALQASKPFADLMQELIETENRVATARKTYNENVGVYNVYMDKIPASWVGYALGYRKQAWFDPEDTAVQLPDMKLLDTVYSK